jgi:hypothetical protein
MSAAEIKEFMKGFMEFECDNGKITDLLKRVQEVIAKIPGDLHSDEVTNAQFKRKLFKEFNGYLKEAVRDILKEGNIHQDNFKEWLEEEVATVLEDTQTNESMKLWDEYFDPLNDLYGDMTACIYDYYEENYGGGNISNFKPYNGPSNFMPYSGPSISVRPAGRRSKRSNRKTRRSNRKSRRNNSRRRR